MFLLQSHGTDNSWLTCCMTGLSSWAVTETGSLVCSVPSATHQINPHLFGQFFDRRFPHGDDRTPLGAACECIIPGDRLGSSPLTQTGSRERASRNDVLPLRCRMLYIVIMPYILAVCSPVVTGAHTHHLQTYSWDSPRLCLLTIWILMLDLDFSGNFAN